MADLTSTTVGSTTIGANFEQIVNTQGLSGRLIIASVNKGTGDINEAELVALTKALGNAGGSGNGSDQNGPDAFTVVGISAFDGSDPMYIALQGTGTLSTGAGDYVADITVAAVATFDLAV
jgi:hypothetical protein